MQNKTVAFVHIPKTAGSTLIRQIVPRQYSKEEIFETEFPFPESYERLIGLDQNTKKKIRFLQGHMGFGIHRYIPQDVQYITFLREPVERVISLYCYIRRRPYPSYFYNETDHSRHSWEDRSLRDMIESSSFKELENGQTRRLASTDGKFYIGECNQETLGKAKKNITEKFAMAGITNQFDESILYLRELLGWKNICYSAVNANKDKKKTIVDLTAADIETIHEYNQLDMDLYEFTSELFNSTILNGNYVSRGKLKRFTFYNTNLFPISRRVLKR